MPEGRAMDGIYMDLAGMEGDRSKPNRRRDIGGAAAGPMRKFQQAEERGSTMPGGAVPSPSPTSASSKQARKIFISFCEKSRLRTRT